MAAGVLSQETSLVAFKVHEVISWGRSCKEQRQVFSLTGKDLAGRTLGCGDSPASFDTGATVSRHAVTPCDPLYAFSPAEIDVR